MYNPINDIELDLILEKKESEFFAFSKHIKEKYKLSNDILKLLDVISFEELLALKLEKSIRIFNGKLLLPLKDVYSHYINRSIFMLIDAYEDNLLKKKIRTVLVLNRRNKLKVYKLYKKFTKAVYDKI